jgi:plastocyanin
MRIVRPNASAVAIGAIVLAACSQTGPAYGPPVANTAATIEMSGFHFDPGTARVKTGETVEWRNKSFFAHSVSADPVRFPNDVSLPAGAAPFDSGRIAAGEVYRHTFTTPGTYKYVCTPHIDLGMVGTVIVDPR